MTQTSKVQMLLFRRYFLYSHGYTKQIYGPKIFDVGPQNLDHREEEEIKIATCIDGPRANSRFIRLST